jgi:polysaccharide pyruvyl transferase WcaK-like protein
MVADPAFTMQASSPKRANEILTSEGIDTRHRPVVGVTMSLTSIIAEKRKSLYLRFMESIYLNLRIVLPEKWFQFMVKQVSRMKYLNMLNYIKLDEMVKIVDYLSEKLDATVILIPHEKIPRQDDTTLCREILKRVKQKNKVNMINGNYSAPEVKAIIGYCDLFVGGKMHPSIAATSMGVPTVVIMTSHKFDGIMRQLGQDNYVCRNLVSEEVSSKIDLAWSNRYKIKAELQSKIDVIKELAIFNAKLTAELIKSKQVSNTT